MNKKTLTISALVVILLVLLIVATISLSFHKITPVPPAFSVSPSTAPPEIAYRDDQGEVILVIDPQGRRAGVNPYSGVIYQEIPGSYYVENKYQQYLTIPNPATGTYMVSIWGGWPGHYALESFVNDGNNVFSQVASGTIPSEGTIIYSQQYIPGNLAGSAFTLASTTASIYAPLPRDNPWFVSLTQVSPEIVNIPSSSSIPGKLQSKVAYMQGGEVWVAGEDGSNQLQLTHTSGSVSKGSNGNFFTFSPGFHYLAYIASGAVTILDLDKNQVIQQITKETIKQFSAITIPDNQTPYVSFQNWVNDDQFVWLAWGLDGPGGGADVAGRLLVDLQKGTTTLMQP